MAALPWIEARKKPEVGAPPAAAPAAPAAQEPTPWDEATAGEEVGLEGTVTDDSSPLDLNARGREVLAKEPDLPRTNVFDALKSGFLAGGLRGFDDEITSGAASAIMAPFSDKTFGEIYDQVVANQRAEKQAAFEQHPIAYGAGFMPSAMRYSPNVSASSGLGRFAQALGIGGAEGAASGAGNSDGGDMGMDAIMGGGLGVLGAGVLTPMMAAGAGAGRRIWNMFSHGGENSGLNKLNTIAPQDPVAMRQRAQEFTDAGVKPRVVDIVDESGHGVMRQATNQTTPAREEVVRHADQVYHGAQDRVASQARDKITAAPGTARSLGRDIAEEQTALGPDFDAVRQNEVAMTPEVRAALDTSEGRSVLRAIGRYMTPDEQAGLVKLTKAFALSRKLGSPEDQAAKVFPGFAGLGGDAKKQVVQQLQAQGVIKDPIADAKLTVDVVDKFTRILTKRAGELPGLQRVAKQYAETLRGAARNQHAGYNEALNTFEANARVADAASGTGRFEQTDFLKTPADEYAHRVGQAGTTAPDNLPSERGALVMRARDDVVDAATSGSGANAGRTARQLAYGGGDSGAGQAARNKTLLGEDGAQQLQQGMHHEVERVKNTDFIDPRRGSKTAGMQQDAAVAGFLEAADTIASAKTGGVWGFIKATAKWLHRGGIRGVDAERLARDAISSDPARVDAAIAFLEAKGMRSDNARKFIGKLGAVAAGRTAGASQGQPASSVRDLYRQNNVGEVK